MTTELTAWVANRIGAPRIVLSDLAQDASFKRFYRTQYEGKSFVVMTAPPEKENLSAFYSVANLLAGRGLTVPAIIAHDLEKGYFLMSDFGDNRYHEYVTLENMDSFYRQALSAILAMQKGPLPDLPVFGEEFVRRECGFFTEWCLSKALGLCLHDADHRLLETVFARLVKNVEEQPQVLVHRDFHSQNLFALKDVKQNPGIIDFQDAVIGPITYDLVSLLKDCRLALPAHRVRSWVEDFYLTLVANRQLPANELDQFFQWFDWMGLQLHVKVLGIFSRLCFRDNKPQYLYHMPRIMNYILNTASQYEEFLPFHDWMQTRVLPAFGTFWQAQHISILPTPRDHIRFDKVLVA